MHAANFFRGHSSSWGASWIHSYQCTNDDYHFNWSTWLTRPCVSRAKLKVARKSIISILFGRHLLKKYFAIRSSLKHAIVFSQLIQFFLTDSCLKPSLNGRNFSSIFSLNITVAFIFFSVPFLFPFHLLFSHAFQQSTDTGYQVLHFGFPLQKQEFMGSLIVLVS